MAITSNDAWRDLLALRVWTLLPEIAIETTTLSDNVRKITEGKYVVVAESDLSGNASDGPYVTMVAWAETDGAALRAIDAVLEADTERSDNVLLPVELLPEPTAAAYAAIVSCLKKRGEAVLESGEYRIATDGVFLHKVIRSSVAAYYFRSPEESLTKGRSRSRTGSALERNVSDSLVLVS